MYERILQPRSLLFALKLKVLIPFSTKNNMLLTEKHNIYSLNKYKRYNPLF